MMNIVELMAGEDDQRGSPCKFGNIVEGHACYCHNPSDLMPRKCPIWRSYSVSDPSKWRREPWLPDSPHIRVFYGEKDPRNVYDVRPTWPDEGCPCFEPSDIQQP